METIQRRIRDLTSQRLRILACAFERALHLQLLHKDRPRCLGLSKARRCKDFALPLSLANGDDDIVRLAIGLYALYRTINTIRFGGESQPKDPSVLLRIFSKQAVDLHHPGYFI